MVKFIHTSDWHIGMKANRLGKTAEKIREQRISSISSVMDKAVEEEVDFVLIAGDLFENNAVERSVVDTVIDAFREYQEEGIDVYILPGNHDPLVDGSIYQEPGWEETENVHVFRDCNRVIESDIVFHPCPLTQKKSNSDPTENISVNEDNEKIHIGVAHGTLDIGLTTEPNFPIDPSRAEEEGLDYLALGEWHSWFEQGDTSQLPITLYPGAHEQTKFDESDPGNIALVTITGKKKDRISKVESIEVGKLNWMRWTKDITEAKSLESLIDEISDIDDPENTVLEIYLQGVVSPDLYTQVEDLKDRVDENFLFFDIETDDLLLVPSKDELMGVIPQELMDVAKDLQSLMSRDPKVSKLMDMDAEEMSERLEEIRRHASSDKLRIPEDDIIPKRALLELYRLAEEVKE
ncbi:MAG: metallophosphoesterase family protein [Candidatus Natronoplasma sp.]